MWLVRTLVWGLAALWLGRWLSGFQPKPILPLIRSLLIALVLILCLSTFLSVNRSIALFGSLDRANGVLTQLSYLLLFGCVATQINPERSRRLLFVIILTAIPICLLGLAQAAGWQPLPVTTDARSPITTTLGRANFTGAYLALLLPLTLAAAQSGTGRWRRMAYGTLFGLELIVIVLTQARAAWIAAGVGVSLFLWLTYAPRWSRRGRWLSGLGGAAGLAGGLVLILQQGIASGGSIAARWTIWQASLRLLWPHLWLGYGADTLELTFPSVYPPQLVYYQGRGVVVDRAHNWLLDWSLNYGVVATLVFSAIVRVDSAGRLATGIGDTKWLRFKRAKSLSIPGWRPAWRLFALNLWAICFCLRWQRLPFCFGCCWRSSRQRQARASPQPRLGVPAPLVAERHHGGALFACGRDHLAGQSASPAGRHAQLARHPGLGPGESGTGPAMHMKRPSPTNHTAPPITSPLP